MTLTETWNAINDAVTFAASCIDDDRDPRNDRELADGHQYVARIVRAVTESALLVVDPSRPSFLPMLDSVRHLGAAGPDIDYDVAILVPGQRYRISGRRGEAGYVGIAVYSGGGADGAAAIVDSVDVDTLVDADGGFTFDIDQPEATRVIVRQYFHDRASQPAGTWTIERLDPATGAPVDAGALAGASLPTPETLMARLTNAASSIRWNAQLNRLWTPDRRDHPNEFVRQGPDEIIAAVPNPDVVYSFTWWRIGDDEALVVELDPPDSPYWGIQLCDRWFQCFPDRRSNVNDRELVREPDGTVRIVVADGDPGHPNWLDTSGHHTGTLFFRWLHADPEHQPTCRVVPRTAVPALG